MNQVSLHRGLGISMDSYATLLENSLSGFGRDVRNSVTRLQKSAVNVL